jgi:prepilin-type N-terminal cleavage/methylation domain-containing protein
MPRTKTMKGFTLIEILVVVALIAILTAITFIAINPAKNFADTRNAQRSSDVTQILNAITQYTSEQGHTLTTLTPDTIPTCTGDVADMTEIGTDAADVDLSGLVDEYIVGIPYDPSSGYSTVNSGYVICQTTGGRVQVDAPHAENSKLITVRR